MLTIRAIRPRVRLAPGLVFPALIVAPNAAPNGDTTRLSRSPAPEWGKRKSGS